MNRFHCLPLQCSLGDVCSNSAFNMVDTNVGGERVQSKLEGLAEAEAVEQTREALAVLDAHVSNEAHVPNELDFAISGSSTEDSKTEDRDLNETEDEDELIWPVLSDEGVLNLSNRQLTHLSISFDKFSLLVVLDVSKNNLEELPLGELRVLKVLNVSGNKLKTLPESVGECRLLEELDASFNQLEYLPWTFGFRLSNLQKLLLHLNKLTDLPAALGHIRSLTHLEVQFNKLIRLPYDIGKLRKLRLLNASSNFNNLSSLPCSIGDLVSLSHLDLSYNQITKLPLSFGKLTQLEYLKLDQNPLTLPPKHVVEHSTKAVVEYMGELLQRNDYQPNSMARSSSSTSLSSASSSSSTSSGAWLTDLLGGMCRSTSGGCSSTKYFGLHPQDED